MIEKSSLQTVSAMTKLGPDDHNLPAYDMTAGFKPFTVF